MKSKHLLQNIEYTGGRDLGLTVYQMLDEIYRNNPSDVLWPARSYGRNMHYDTIIYSSDILETYLCSRSSCNRKDLITGTWSGSSWYGVMSLVSRDVASVVCFFSVKTVSMSILMRSGSGGLWLPKQRLETTSMKNSRQLLCMEFTVFGLQNYNYAWHNP